MRTKNVRIKKTGEDDYSYSIPEDHVIDEDVNGPQLMGVLDNKLVETTLDAVMARLDGLKVNQEITVQLQSPL
jgi:hypothetical protein